LTLFLPWLTELRVGDSSKARRSRNASILFRQSPTIPPVVFHPLAAGLPEVGHAPLVMFRCSAGDLDRVAIGFATWPRRETRQRQITGCRASPIVMPATAGYWITRKMPQCAPILEIRLVTANEASILRGFKCTSGDPRFLAASAWASGSRFHFYGAVVIPLGEQVLGSHRPVGFITQEVSNWLNLIAASPCPGVCKHGRRWTNSTTWRKLGLAGAWLAMALSLVRSSACIPCSTACSTRQRKTF